MSTEGINARQVGYALSHGRMGKDFPAYRVVNRQGYLSGAAAFEVSDMQRRLLEADGVEVEDDRINLKVFGWHSTMEEAEFFYDLFLQMGI